MTGVESDRFREALAQWASGVAVVAVREEGKVFATTVTALLSVALSPPLVLVSLGATAQVLPYLGVGRSFGISVLTREQGRIATLFADSYPVGAPPFPSAGDEWVEGALVRLGCRVERVDEAGDHRLVLALVERAEVSPGQPLLRWARGYRGLAPD